MNRFAPFIICCAAAWAQNAAGNVARMRADLEFLTAPELEGRTSLQRSSDIAAKFVASEFSKAGLQPFNGSFFQQFALIEHRTDGAASRLAMTRNGDRESFRYQLDYRGGFWKDTAAAGALVFTGYGITAKEYGYDDYKGIDARGKVVLIFDHEPQEDNPASVFHGTGLTRYAGARSKVLTAAAHGAVAVLVMPEPKRKHGSTFDPPASSTRGYAPSQASGEIRIPYLQVSESTATRLLASGGKTPLDLQNAIDANLHPQSFDVSGVRIEIEITNRETRRGMTANVAGMLEGSDATLRSETVLVTSHYDHLPPRDGRIFPGANDNGSGTVAVMELARAFSTAPRPKRTLVFISFGAEEEGLLGSYYYVQHPLRPLETTRAVINLDMVGRNEAHIPLTRGRVEISGDTSGELNIAGANYSPDLMALLDRANTGVELKLSRKYDRDSSQNVLFRCDHFPFLMRNIPAVWLFGGFHPEYHESSDTVDRIDFRKLQKVFGLAYNAARLAADEPSPPRFLTQ